MTIEQKTKILTISLKTKKLKFFSQKLTQFITFFFFFKKKKKLKTENKNEKYGNIV